VLWLQGGVRDLENVEHAHRDVVDEVRQDRGTAQEANLACLLEVLEGLYGSLALQHFLGRAEMKLEHVEVVGLQAPQALVAGIDDMLTAVVVEPGQRGA
jgi:hypothetical protein